MPDRGPEQVPEQLMVGQASAAPPAPEQPVLGQLQTPDKDQRHRSISPAHLLYHHYYIAKSHSDLKRSCFLSDGTHGLPQLLHTVS